MKKILLFFVAALTGVTLLSSCGGNDENPYAALLLQQANQRETDWVVGVNTDPNVAYDLTMFDKLNGDVTQVQLHGNGTFERIDFISNTYQDMMSILFDEDGMFQGYAADELTVMFSNFNGNKADVAYIYKDEMAIIKEMTFFTNWDQIKQELTLSNASPAREMTPSTRGSISEWFFSAVDDADRWLKDHQKMFKALDEAKSSFDIVNNTMKKGGQIIVQGAQLNMRDANAIEKVLNDTKDLGKDLLGETASKFIEDNTESGGFFLAANEAFQTFKNRAVEGASWPYSVLLKLLANYSEYTEFCENVTYEILVTIDSWNKPNTNLAIGALNSGTGDLKVTLSWNFLADIDLHAYESFGSHIYYVNKSSYYSDGFLDVDDRDGRGAFENIYWQNPPEGSYDIYINYFGSSLYDGSSESGNCSVTILYKGVGKVYNFHMSPGTHNVFVASIHMPDGTISNTSTRTPMVYNWEPKD